MSAFGWDKWQVPGHRTEWFLGSFRCFNVCPLDQHILALQHHLSFTYHCLPVKAPFKEYCLMSFLVLCFFLHAKLLSILYPDLAEVVNGNLFLASDSSRMLFSLQILFFCPSEDTFSPSWLSSTTSVTFRKKSSRNEGRRVGDKVLGRTFDT